MFHGALFQAPLPTRNISLENDRSLGNSAGNKHLGQKNVRGNVVAGGGCAYNLGLALPAINASTSARLLGFSLKMPRKALVTMTLPGFLAPRMVMQV